MKLNHIFYIVFLLISNNIALAQKNSYHKELTSKKMDLLNYTQQEIIHSKVLNEDIKINIFLPYLLSQNKTTEAKERWIEYNPKSILTLNELAKGYEVNNDLSKALFTLKKTCKLSSKLETEESHVYQI